MTPESRGDPATLFFRNQHLLWLSMIVILVGGLSAALTLPRLEDPHIINRDPLVITPVPGASAARVEALVTEVLEESLDEIDEIKIIDSVSRAGVSIVNVEFNASVTEADSERLFAKVRDKIGEVTSRLPAEAGDPIVDDMRDPAAFTLILGLTWNDPRPPQIGLLSRLAEELADRLRSVRGTEIVRIYGQPEEEIVVEVDPAELAELGLSAADVTARIARADAKRPAGTLRGDRSDVLLEVTGELDSIGRIESVPLADNDAGAMVSVGDIGEVSRSWRTPEDEVALVDGRRSVLVAARISCGVRVDQWAARAESVVNAFETGRSDAIRVDRVFEQESYTTERLGTLASNLLAGAAVVLLTVFLMMGFRPAIIVGIALPLVIAIVIFGWQMTGGAIHQMSIFGMIIALGLLIDNAIVVTDEVAAAKAQGAAPIDAVRQAVRHLFLPLLASTITTILAFAPIMLLPGSAGDFVSSIGTSVILAIGASFLVAMTITAALAGRFVTPTAPGARRRWWRDGIGATWLTRGYARTLRTLYGVPVVAIAIALTLPAAGFIAGRTLGSQFFPPVDRNMFEMRVWLPGDTAIGSTVGQATDIERTLRTLDGIEHVSWLVGGSHPTVYYNLVMNQDRSPHYAHAVVTTTSPADTKRLITEAQTHIDTVHPGAQVVVRRLAQGPPVLSDIEYRLFGPSIEVLQDLGDELRIILQEHPDVLHTQATMPRGEPKLFLHADEQITMLSGLTLTDVADQIQANLEGQAGGSVLEDLESLDVRVRYSSAERGDLAGIEATPLVLRGSDDWTTASTLGTFHLRPELGGITRYNRQRMNEIKAYVHADALPIDVGSAVLAQIEASDFRLPPGYRLEVGGATEQDAEAKANLATYAPLLLTLMVATLVLAFRSVAMALMLGVVALLSLGLALLSTWTIQFPISFNTILGTLGLIGVALNDSIVVLAAIRSDPRAAAGDRDAMVDAVLGCTRHVIATTLTTIGGFLPLLIFVGGDFWPSLSVVLVGGIGGASIVALLFIPGVCLLWPHRPRDIPAAPAPATTIALNPA